MIIWFTNPLYVVQLLHQKLERLAVASNALYVMEREVRSDTVKCVHDIERTEEID